MIEFHYTEGIGEWQLRHPTEVSLWLTALAERHGKSIAHINYVFGTDDYVLELNQAHLQHDFYTDILTFQLSEPDAEEIEADIFISLERVEENAAELQQAVVDELHRVMAHGLLHCLGYDDHTDAEEAEMRKQEEIALALRMF
jgi:rRNA maturation RNase YbeY